MRKLATVTGMFAALAVIAAMPFLLLEYELRRCVVGEVISVGAAAFSREETEVYGLRERIGALFGGVCVDSGVAGEDAERIVSAAEREVARLSALSVIPTLPKSARLRADVIKNTYIERETGKTVSVYEVEARYADYVVYAYIDTDTSAICDVTVYSNEDLIYASGISADGFIAYHESFYSAPGSFSGFEAHTVYEKRLASVCLSSVGEDGERIVYRFRRFPINVETGQTVRSK